RPIVCGRRRDLGNEPEEVGDAMNSFGIGQPVRRVEDRRFLTGRARYVDDVELPRQAHGALVLSPHAHARIRQVDISRAAAAAGVICVLTGDYVERDRLGGYPPLALPVGMGVLPG